MGSMDFLVLHYVFLSLLLLIAAQALEEHFEHENEIYGMFQNGFPNDVTPQTYPSNFTFASYYGNHMVLQRAPKQAVIWGYSPNIGEVIKVKVEGQKTVSATVYKDNMYGVGIWKVTLPPVSQPGPFTITASSALEAITLTDVLFGDVWICSGQSNMQFTVDKIFNGSAELGDAANYPHIRLFDVSLKYSPLETLDLLSINEGWTLPSKSTLADGTGVYFSAVCWLYGKYLYQELGYPIGLIDTSYGGTPIEAWSSRDALAQCGISSTEIVESFLHIDDSERDTPGYRNQLTPTQLWNCMIHPLLNMTIYGAIWYQGENNAMPGANTHKYNCTFPAMISDWRLKFNQGSLGQTDKLFPFGFVQLGPMNPDPPTSGFPEIRWHQTADYGYVPNPKMEKTFMAVAMDLADFISPWWPVHFRDKTDVGKRLVAGGLRVAYSWDVLADGPQPIRITEGTNNLTLTYTQQILYHNRDGFEILCSVQSKSNGPPSPQPPYWTSAPIVSPLPTSITLYSLVCGEGQTVLGLRYSWRESPCAFKTCTVYSADNPLLPGPPFLVYQKMTGVAGTVHTIDWNTPTPIHN